ncbi:MAG: HlyC/CorC family transporter [Bacteroidaceae bacterium]|nr:HlyC/CorC family transporter [Bacteroidaceae bacterium]
MQALLIILLLVGLNAFFSLSEVALISARRSRLQVAARKGSRTAKMALELQADTDKFLSTAQIGITVVSILTGIYSGAELSDDFALWLSGVGLPQEMAHTLSKAVILVGATYLQCELGELFPKRIGIDLADAMAKLCAPPMLFLAGVARPFVWLLSVNTDLLVRLFHLHKENEGVTEEEIKSVIQEGTESGEVEAVEGDIMERAMVMGDQTVDHLMTHRTEIVALDLNMSAREIEAIVHDHPFAGYPVGDGQIENLVGYVKLKDLVARLGHDDFRLQPIIRKPIYFPENITVYKALEHLKKSHQSLAFVCDEFGSLLGLITWRDIFEGLVGTISDGAEPPDIIERSDHQSWIVSGQCPFYEFVEHFGQSSLYVSDHNTLAGLLLVLFDHIPTVGEQCEWHMFLLRVISMDGNRIDKVLVRLKEDPNRNTEQTEGA